MTLNRSRIAAAYKFHGLREVIKSEEPPRSLIERASDWWEAYGANIFWGILALIVLAAVSVAALVVATA